MAISLVGVATFAEAPSTDDGSTITGTPPEGAGAGHVLVAILTHHSATPPDDVVGWVTSYESNGSNQTGLKIYHQILTGPPEADYTFPRVANRSSLVILALAGVDLDNLFDIGGTRNASAAATSIVHQTATTTVDDVFTILVGVQNTTTTSAFTWPEEMFVIASSTANIGKRMGVAGENRPVAGDIGTRTITSSTSSAWNSAKVYFRAAADTVVEHTDVFAADASAGLSIGGTVVPLLSAVLPMAATVDSLVVAGSLSHSAVLPMAAAVDNLVVGGLRTQLASLAATAAPRLTLAGVRSQLAALPMDETAAMLIQASPQAGLSVGALAALLASGSMASASVLAASAAPRATIGPLATHPYVLAVRGTPAATWGGLRIVLAVLAARGTPGLVVAGQSTRIAVLSMRAVPGLSVSAVIAIEVTTYQQAAAEILDNGVRLGVLVHERYVVELLGNGMSLAVIKRRG